MRRRTVTDDKLLVDEARRSTRQGRLKASIRPTVVPPPSAFPERSGAERILDTLFGIVYVLLALRLALALVSARPDAGFVRAIRALSDPLLLPLQGILSVQATEEGYLLALPVILAIGVYGAVHLLLRPILRLLGAPRAAP